MQQIINFLIRNKHSLLFLFLIFLSLVFTTQSHNYHKSKFISSTNFLSGSIYTWQHRIIDYFGLKKENKRLLEENKRLHNLLSATGIDSLTTRFVDTTSFKKPYTYTKARVIKNDYSKLDNYM